MEVRGGQHRVKDMGGSGTQERNHRFSESLPNRDVPVSLHEIHGRGRVQLVQVPSRSNGDTAVVEVTDDKDGDDDYELELTWRN